MTHFVTIAKELDNKGAIILTAVFKAVAIHISVHDEQQLMRGASRFGVCALKQYGHVPVSEAWKAINALTKAQIEIKTGKVKIEDFPDVKTFPHVWRFELTG